MLTHRMVCFATLSRALSVTAEADAGRRAKEADLVVRAQLSRVEQENKDIMAQNAALRREVRSCVGDGGGCPDSPSGVPLEQP
jgi:hypothetical protein